jgi:hypothetical protein
MKYYLLFFLSIFLLGTLSAQQNDKTIFEELASHNTEEGIITITQPTDIKTQILGHADNMKKFIGSRGYRIQISFFSGNRGRKKAYQQKSKLLEQLPQYMSYIIYVQPYFKVRIGDFFDKTDALKALESVKNFYPNAFIVEDLIDYKKAVEPTVKN